MENDKLVRLSDVRLIESRPDAYPEEWNDSYEKGFVDAINAVLDIPTVDAVEVVRCRECEMANACSDEREMYCLLYHAYKPIDYFCGDGQRKEEHNAAD